MKQCMLSMIAVLLMAPGVCAAAAPIDGAWNAKVPTPNGQASFDVVFTLRMDGPTLTGTAAAAGGQPYDLVNTKISGDVIAFAVDGEPAEYTGSLSGDEIKMEVTFKSSENGTRKWSFIARRSLAPQSQAEGPSIDGDWTGDVPRGGGRFIAATFTFHADGTTLTGHVSAVGDEFPLVNGTIAGARIAFRAGNTQGDYSGELDGDTIHMKVKYNGGESGRQTIDFVLKRAVHPAFIPVLLK